MSPYLFWFLLLFGFTRMIIAIWAAAQHGKPRGNYNGGIEAINAIIGLLMILFACEVL